MGNNGIDLSVFNGLKEMMGDDFIGELVDTYLQDSPELFQQMHQALDAQDAESFRRAAHSLKSNSANFGAMQLSALARELEMMGREGRLEGAEARVQQLVADLAGVQQGLRVWQHGA